MYRNEIDVDKLKSDEFKGLKKDREELLPASYNYNAIKGVQNFLNEEGYTDKNNNKLWEDGIYGANTANAVIKYQRANGLSVDGIVGDETWNSIYRKKKEKEEDAFGKNPRLDVWVKNYNPFTENKKDEGEDFHERVRKRWGNGGRVALPEIKDYAEERSPKRLPFVPEPFSYAAESPEKTDYLITDNALDYQIFNGNGNTPNLTLMSDAGRGGSSESKDEEVQKITITEADRNIINDGIYDKAKNAKEFPDSQNVVGTDYRSYYDFDETPAKSVLAGKLNTALETAIANDDQYSQQVIKTTIDNVESFDDSAITSVYYLNDEDGAMTAGHSGILMVNSEGKGILFSFYPQNQKFPYGLFYSPSEMRISVLSGPGLENFLSGSAVLSASTSGKKRAESYDRVLQYETTPEQGKAMFEQAVAITGLGFSYDLAYRNCDHIALSILGSGGIAVDKMSFPNNSFEEAAGE